ncbi:MAG: hypothetical protein JSU87_13245, partial [Gemmatimonadota bacterium]
ERSSLFGWDVGWETNRNLDMNWTYRPNIAAWLTPQLAVDTRFRMSRGASFVTEVEGDTVLTRDFGNSRTLRFSTGFNLASLLRDLLGEERTGTVGTLLGLVDRIDLFTITWIGSLASNYQRRTADPSLRYQLGIHGFGGVVVQDADSASRVNDNKSLTLGGGVRLPTGLAVTVEYANNDGLVWTPRSQTTSRTTTWPSLNLNWNRLPLPAFLQSWVSRLGLRAGYSLRTQSSVVANATQDREGQIKTIPFNFDLMLTTDWSLNYNLTMTDEERRDPTGLTLGERLNQAVQLTGRIRPLSRQGRLRNPIRLSLRLSQNDSDQCRRLGGVELGGLPPGVSDSEFATCEPFTDLRIRSVDLTFSTDVPPFAIGLQGSWRDTQSQLGQRPGSTQLEISLFGQFLFETGELR